MTIAIHPCGTLDPMAKPVDEEEERQKALLIAALRARQHAERTVEKRRDDLAEAIVTAYRTGKFKAAAIAKLVDYTPEHVRRILRAHGIEGDPTRLSPTQRALLAADRASASDSASVTVVNPADS